MLSYIVEDNILGVKMQGHNNFYAAIIGFAFYLDENNMKKTGRKVFFLFFFKSVCSLKEDLGF